MKPRLSLCMIVRDEAHLLPNCLDSVVGVVDEAVVVDTGSTDGTPEIARSRGARVVEYPWSGDFAAARNVGLEEAHGEWVLVLDADEALHPSDRETVRGLLLAGNVEGYLSTQVNFIGDRPGTEAEYGFSQRLFRNRPQYRYRGRIHERVELPQSHVRVAPVRILHYGYLQPLIGNRQKRERNVALLEEVLKEHPEDPLVHYYLGGEYRAQGRDAEAVAAYLAAKPPALQSGYLFASKLMKNLAASLLNLGHPQKALLELEEGISHFPEFTDLVYLQGSACRSLGRLPEAIGYFHQCLAMGPAAAPPHLGVEPDLGGWKAEHALAITHEMRGEWEKAAGFYRRGWLSGRNGGTLGRLSRLLVIHRGPDQAEAELTGLVEPLSADVHLQLAEALVAGRHWRAALRRLESAEAETGSEAVSHPAVLHASAATERKARLCQIEAVCRFHLGDFAGAHAAFSRLPAEVFGPERLVVALTTGVMSPGELLAELGVNGARQAAAGCLAGAVSALEQGLYRQPESVVLQSALARSIQEVRRLA